MKQIKPPIGQKYGKWTVLGQGKTASLWICKCECGREKPLHHNNLRYGKSRQCHGCFATVAKRTHGESTVTRNGKPSSEYRAYLGARTRCQKLNHPMYKYYGKRGIKFCFTSFLEFIEEVGHKPTAQHSLDRINNDGNYEKGNVKWSTKQEQVDNRRTTLRVTYNGKTQSLSAWGHEWNWGASKLQIIRQRMVQGWEPVEALLTPIKSEVYEEAKHSETQTKYQHPPK